MVEKSKKTQGLSLATAASLYRYASLLIPVAVIFLGVCFLIIPSVFRLILTSQNITQKENEVVTVDRSHIDLQNLQAEYERYQVKAVELGKKLPQRLKTNLIIETLREITEKSKLKFSSLEPLPIKKYVYEPTKSVFVELPVKVKLNCGFYDFVDFLKQIETASQMMKIGDFVIRSNPSSDWDHDIELTISAFSKGDSDE